MVTLTRIHCITSDSHEEVLKVLEDHKVKHSYHVVDSWGLHSVVHAISQDIEKLLENIKDTNIKL
jgi:hypothetical protein